jgi:carboxypeptidase family protein
MNSSASRSGIAVVACVIVFAIGPSQALAQRGQVSALWGVVRDATGNPLSGVEVTVSSDQLIGGPQTVISDQEGRYRFSTLLPGTYTLAAVSTGFETLRRSAIDLFPGLGATVDIVMNVASLATTVEVHATVPAVDVRSSSSQQLIERPLLDNLPVPLTRSLIEYINLTPGVADDVALGGAAFANPITIDGTNATSPVHGAPDSAPVVSWADSVQVVAVGANAEYGEYSSARMNVITRSGSNRYSGLGEYWWTRPGWSNWRELLEWRDVIAQAGGPVLHDRIWFFAGIEDHENVSRTGAFQGPRTGDEPLVEARERKFFGKLTAAPGRSTRVEGFISHGSNESLNANARPGLDPAALGKFGGSEDVQNLRFTWTVDKRTLLEAHYGLHRGRSGQGPTSPERRSGPPAHFDQATRTFSVNYQQIIEDEENVQSGEVKITRYISTRSGAQHELKGGLEYERDRVRVNQNYPGDSIYLDRNGQPELIRFWEGARYRPSHHRTSLFVQDSWQLGQLTLEPGLRLGFYDSSVPNPPSRTYSNHSISPRVGAAWDLSPDHRTVLRGHYGHYHDPMSTRFYEYLDPTADSPLIVARVLGPGQFEEITRIGGPTNIPTIDPDIKHSYTEEWFGGIEREVWPRVSVKAQYIRRNVRNAIGFTDTGSVWIPASVIDPGPDGVLQTADDGRELTIYYRDGASASSILMTNPPGAWRHFDGIQFVGTRRFADGWSLQASYSWGRTVGSFDNENGSNSAGTDLASGGNFSNPNRAINTVGRTVFDRRHDARVFGTYSFPYWGGVRVSGIYRYTSGAPWGRSVDSFDPRTQTAVLVEPVGTRQLPAINQADLRMEKTFTLPARAVAGIYADIFNLTNQVVAKNVIQSSGSMFERAFRWTEPRRFRVGVRVTF